MEKITTITMCILYVLSPIDFMPEILLGPLGIGDDLVALIIAMRTFLHTAKPGDQSAK